jgi:hypothetical protein
MIKNLIGKNYEKFTFDLVVHTKYKIGIRRKHLTFDNAAWSYVYQLWLGFWHITVWIKKEIPNAIQTPYGRPGRAA